MEIMAGEGDEIEVGSPLFVIMEGAEGAPPAAASSSPSPSSSSASSSSTSQKSEAAKAPAAPSPEKKTQQPSTQPSSSSQTTDSGDRSETRVKMTRMRQRIAERLKESQNVAAMLTTFQEVVVVV